MRRLLSHRLRRRDVLDRVESRYLEPEASRDFIHGIAQSMKA